MDEHAAAAADNDNWWRTNTMIPNYQLPHYKLIKIYSYNYQMLNTMMKPEPNWTMNCRCHSSSISTSSIRNSRHLMADPILKIHFIIITFTEHFFVTKWFALLAFFLFTNDGIYCSSTGKNNKRTKNPDDPTRFARDKKNNLHTNKYDKYIPIWEKNWMIARKKINPDMKNRE